MPTDSKHSIQSKWKMTYTGTMVLLFVVFWLFFFIAAKKLRADQLKEFDSRIIEFIQGYINDPLTAFMRGVTFFGGKTWIIAAVLVLSIILLFIRKRYAVYLLLTSAVGSVFNVLLKHTFQRERPDIYPLITEQGYSFPSGHSMGSFIFYISVAVVLSKLSKNKMLDICIGILFALLVLLIGISRIYLGVHYPSDVIAGFGAGGCWIIICTLALRNYEKRKNRRERSIQ